MSWKKRVSVWQGNITELDLDAIVNAANSSLLGGGGVDGAIHRAAGPELVHECRLLGGCKTGQAKLTRGHKLRARFIIHTVGPVWRGGDHGEREQLRSCYLSSLQIASQDKMTSIAFPGISTGIFRFPVAEAARIAVGTTATFLDASKHPASVVFCTFNTAATDQMSEAIENHKQ